MPNLLLTMWDTIKSSNIGILVAAGLGMFAIIGGLSMLSYHYTLSGIKSRTVGDGQHVPFPVSWTVKMKKKQKETQDILSYHTQAAGCSDKARAKASGGRQPIEECGRTGL